MSAHFARNIVAGTEPILVVVNINRRTNLSLRKIVVRRLVSKIST
jgi:hypothetical protein